MSTQLDAASIARVSLHDPTHLNIQISQTVHRLVLLQHWNIPTNSKVLELGCGQGDCTTVLASAVGEQGKVVAVDPAELNYGQYAHCYDRVPITRHGIDSSYRCPVYSRPSTESHLTRPAGWTDYLGPTIPPELLVYPTLQRG